MKSEDPGSALYMRLLEELENAERHRSEIEVQLEQARAVEKRLEAQVEWLVDRLYPQTSG